MAGADRDVLEVDAALARGDPRVVARLIGADAIGPPRRA
jgi:hypothetical protein